MNYNDLSSRPLKLKHNRVWRPFKGGMLLDKWQNCDNPNDDHYGEEWVASTVEVLKKDHTPNEGQSLIVMESGDNILLKEAIDSNPPAFLGSLHSQKYGNNMALLAKVIDSCSRLLVQVHPDRDYAKTILGSEFGKTEAWYIIDSRTIDGEEPYVLLGFKPGMTRETWKDMFENQDIEGMRNALHRFNVKPGDVFFVNGGVPHAVGSGCFLIEVQEPTDLMMRVERTSLSGVPFTDYECHMGVGFDRMLDCFHYDSYTREETISNHKIEPKLKRQEKGGREISIISPDTTLYFSLDRIDVKESFKSYKEDVFSVAIVLSGKGRIVWDNGEMSINQSDEIFLPAGLGEITWLADGLDELNIVRGYPGR